MFYRAIVAFLIVVAMDISALAVEVLFQNFEISTFAQVSPNFGNTASQDQDTRQNQGFGDRFLESSSATRFLDVSASADAEVAFRRTNNSTSDIFYMESGFSMRSQHIPNPGATQLVMRASAAMTVFLQVRSDAPFQYSLNTFSELGPAMPGSGSITISGASGVPFVDTRWLFGTESSGESQGILPAGTYSIRFSNNCAAEGSIFPWLENHIAGTARASATLSFSPAESSPTINPTLQIRRGTDGFVLVEMNDLRPGTAYIIERNDSINQQFWQFIGNFTAAGTNAVWTDLFNTNSQSFFYRLRY